MLSSAGSAFVVWFIVHGVLLFKINWGCACDSLDNEVAADAQYKGKQSDLTLDETDFGLRAVQAFFKEEEDMPQLARLPEKDRLSPSLASVMGS